MPKLKTERWAFTKTELKNTHLLNSHDELEADVGTEVGVLVYRNGKVTNRWADGTVGVPQEYKEMAEEVEELYHGQFGEGTLGWYDVKVDSKGDFVKFVGERRPLFR